MREIILEAAVENLRHLFDFITKELEAAGVGGKDIRLVKLCVEEIFVNIALYAYYPHKGMARITMDIDNKAPTKISISFYDWGMPFNPFLDTAAPDVTTGIEDRPVGGLGLLLVRTKMDGVTYEYRDGQNVLTMTKQLPVTVRNCSEIT